LVLNGYATQAFGNPVEALASLEDHCYSAVLARYPHAPDERMELLGRIMEQDPDLPVI
jgi:DNA-binding NtrC family response regulator